MEFLCRLSPDGVVLLVFLFLFKLLINLEEEESHGRVICKKKKNNNIDPYSTIGGRFIISK